MKQFLVGTSGWSYRDWIGYFYPKGTRPSDFLRYYAKYFSTTEINSTYYRLPTPELMQALFRKTPEYFVFSVKATDIFTHKREWTQDDARAFKEAVKQLNGKLGVVLFQFPHSFHLTRKNFDYIKKIRDEFQEFPLAFEFRSREWFQDKIFQALEKMGVSLVCVDEPDVPGLPPPLCVSTSPIAYIRFHGRNAQKWYEHEKPEERYDYLYSEEELDEWAEKIVKLPSEKVFVYFNNHPRAQAVQNAQQMIKILGEKIARQTKSSSAS